jgi:hypothetical protein
MDQLQLQLDERPLVPAVLSLEEGYISYWEQVMENSGIEVYSAGNEKGLLVLILSLKEEKVLSELCCLFRNAYSTQEPVVIKCRPRDPDERILSSILIRTTPAGQVERVAIERGLQREQQLIWEGDREYWLECGEKCDALLASGSGHQYLIARGSANQNVIISYLEDYVSY